MTKLLIFPYQVQKPIIDMKVLQIFSERDSFRVMYSIMCKSVSNGLSVCVVCS